MIAMFTEELGGLLIDLMDGAGGAVGATERPGQPRAPALPPGCHAAREPRRTTIYGADSEWR